MQEVGLHWLPRARVWSLRQGEAGGWRMVEGFLRRHPPSGPKQEQDLAAGGGMEEGHLRSWRPPGFPQ